MQGFYLKLYDFSWNRKFIEEDQIIWKSNFSAQIDGSFSDMKLQIKAKINNTEYQIWDFIKIFYGNNIFYQGYIIFINRNLKSNNEYLELTLVTKWSFIANKKLNKNYNDTARNILIDLISECNTAFWQTMLTAGNIEDIAWNIEINFKDQNFFDCIRELQKKINSDKSKHNYRSWPNWWCFYVNDSWNKVYVDSFYCKVKWEKHFFIDFEGKIDFWEKDEKTHKVTLWKDIFEINIWNTDNSVIKSATFHNSTNIKLNNNYNYREILPMDLVKIRNVSYNIEPLRVDKINYNDLGADVFLESFVSFSNLIKKIWN